MEKDQEDGIDMKHPIEEGEAENADEGKYMCEPCGEAEGLKAVRAPKMPTPKEVEDHELTHCPYRSWCEHCVRGQAKDDQHRTVKGPEKDTAKPASNQ